MADSVISVQGLSKKYRLGVARHDTLRDRLTHALRAPFRRNGNRNGGGDDEFWALRDVSFEVARGEVLGIIGRNGAGKSTLLKILSRITEPTKGRISIRGRVASLLEVGTGFHPELTGRENIFLNGAILGMSRTEIRRKFDEIVAFAEVERFLDTPVKHYSSGMYVRLAFAVAAHLEPEILIVDEVLAVGDAQFQKKCLGKMKGIARQEGRTVLFVSHNLNAVRELTSHCIHLRRGELAGAGQTAALLDRYCRESVAAMTTSQGRHATVLSAEIVDRNGFVVPAVTCREPVAVRLRVETDGHPTSSVECYLTDGIGNKLAVSSPCKFEDWYLPARRGTFVVVVPLRVPPLASGRYALDVCTVTKEAGFDHYWPGAVDCEVAPRSYSDRAWDLRLEYQAGFFILDDGAPRIDSSHE